MPDISLNCTRLDSNVIEIEFDDGLLHYRLNLSPNAAHTLLTLIDSVLKEPSANKLERIEDLRFDVWDDGGKSLWHQGIKPRCKHNRPCIGNRIGYIRGQAGTIRIRRTDGSRPQQARRIEQCGQSSLIPYKTDRPHCNAISPDSFGANRLDQQRSDQTAFYWFSIVAQLHSREENR